MPLSATVAKNIKHIGSSVGFKHNHGGGMYLLINVSRKYWRMNYRFVDKRKTPALGLYPSSNADQSSSLAAQ